MHKHFFSTLLCTALFILTLPLTAQTPKIKVACVGNSITYGMALQHRERDAYPFQLQRMLGEAYEVGNFGKSGATLLRRGYRPYFDQVEYKQAMQFAGDIVVIHLGVNDTDPRCWPNLKDEFVSDYLALIDSLRTANPQAKFYVAEITPIADRHWRFQSGTRDWQAQVREKVRQVARLSGATLIDFFKPMYPHPWMLHDAIHPDPEGATLMANVVYGAITGNYGELKLPATFSDHMVLQRHRPLTLSGTANAGSKISLTLFKANKRKLAHATAITDAQGKWEVRLPALEAQEHLSMEVEAVNGDARELRCFSDVAVGEVWLCSGQSNMSFRVNQSLTPKVEKADPSLRLFDMRERWETNAEVWSERAIDSVKHLLYYKESAWQIADVANAQTFSAVAYAYGKMLRDSLQVPIGLICNAVGGSPAESWIDRHSLETQLPAILSNWLHNDFIQDWCRGRAAQNLGLAGTQFNDDFRRRHPYEPCYLFEAGILPLAQYPIKGVIWYQGESNAHNIEAHEQLFPMLVKSWRTHWKNEEMPFYFVQLSSINRPSWPWFRDSQRRLAAQMPHVRMAVSSDVGDSLDVHPRDKQPVGERLARLALSDSYGHSLTPSGPLFEKAIAKGQKLILTFKHAKRLQTSDGKALRTFEIAADDDCFYPAQAEIKGETVVLTCKEVKRPRFVRYGWQPFTRANLVNGDKLPASTFRGKAE